MFAPIKWPSASLSIFAMLFIIGSIAIYEDSVPAGFDNPDGSDTPPFAQGLGALLFWMETVVIVVGVVALAAYIQLS